MKTYKQRTGDILKKAQQKRNNRRKGIAAAISSCACAAVVAFACVLFLPFPQPKSAISAYKNSEYYPVIQQLDKKLNVPKGPVYKNNFDKWTSQIQDLFSVKGGSGDMIMPGTPSWEADNSVADNSTMEGASPDYVETTDNQVQGVIEADLFKRTKTHIFYLDNNLIRAYSIAGAESKSVGAYEVAERENSSRYQGGEFFLSADGKTLTLLRSVSVLNEQGKADRYTEIVSLDVSDPANIAEKGRNYLSGDYVSSRIKDGKLLVINNYNLYSHKVDFAQEKSFLPQYGAWGDMQSVAGEDIVCPETLTTLNYSVICQIDEQSATAQDCMALLSYSTTVYASAENLFVTRRYTEREDGTSQSKTDVSCISYDDGLDFVHTITVAGYIKDQYSMDEYENVFRIVTTTDKGATNASLYCIDMQSFETVGKVENFAPPRETVQSVRFDGEKAYVCTAIVVILTDPVYAFDLSDPKNITYVETGEIKGYSSALVQFSNGFLLGVGYGNSRDSLKVEIFQETAAALESVASYELEAEFSENYKSYFIDRERGFLGLGIYDYSKHKAEYLLLQFDGYALNPILRTELSERGYLGVIRATLIDGYFYIFGRDNTFKVQKIY